MDYNYKVGDYVECIKGPVMSYSGFNWKLGKRFKVISINGDLLYESEISNGVSTKWVKLINLIDIEVNNIKNEIGL